MDVDFAPGNSWIHKASTSDSVSKVRAQPGLDALVVTESPSWAEAVQQPYSFVLLPFVRLLWVNISRAWCSYVLITTEVWPTHADLPPREW
jgi:hypothetical protein